MRAPDTAFMEALTGEVESASTQLFALWPTVRGFATSLHLNLADAFHRPGAVDVAQGYLRDAVNSAGTLPDNDFGVKTSV
ncbi:hypothetical protein [Corynebacterium sp.]|jgi:hypothetical protein|uniref:hypothetical protein n=1 Tax=Corynebacterium sp. TaxID=1720 RepID=UPI0025BA5CCF|nr:hypothetical protein [Corynebacterium sp.]